MRLPLPKIFYSKLFLAASILLLLFVFGLELQQWQKRQAVNKEIALLIAQEQQLAQKNKELEASLQYFTTEAYKEKLARQQLNLKRDGEIVVNFPSHIPEPVTTTPIEPPKPLSNPEKWWNYFFAQK